jgi:hypothetical protein
VGYVTRVQQHYAGTVLSYQGSTPDMMLEVRERLLAA